MHLYRLLASSVLCAFFLATGVIALAWPQSIQRWALRFYEEGQGLAKWNPWRNWMRTSSYVLSLRIVGVLSIAAGCITLLAVLRGT
jgi:hypothetical protein